MKIPTPPSLASLSKTGVLTLALLTAAKTAVQAADTSWTGGTASYNNAANWSPASVPGILDSAINDSGLGNAVQINVGDPDWTVGQIRAGNSVGDGAFVQNGQTVTLLGTNYNGPVITEFVTPFRLGIVAADTGLYTLNDGNLNYGSGPFTVGAAGTGMLNINGGTIAGSGVFAVNYGGISTPNPAVLTATAGHGPYLGDFTYFEQGYYAPNGTLGLPPAGSTVNSVGDPTGHSYTLAPSYTAPNAVIVDAAVPNATITLGTPTACSGLSFMCSCGNGPVNVNYTVNHSSGTPETGTLVVQDWFAGTNTIDATNEVLATYARVDALGRNFQVTGPVNGMTGNPPYMWSADVSVSNPNTVTSISLTFVSGGGSYATATILGVSAQTVAAGPFAPLAITGYNYDVVVENGAASPDVSPSITDIANQTNGSLNISGELWVGNGGAGIYNFTNGAINSSFWLNIGRYGGTGTFNMAGGTINKSGSAFVVGANAGNANAGANGTLNQSAGTINSSSEVWIGQANNNPGLGTGTYNLSGTGALNVTNWLAIGREGGIGVLNISGGSITKTGNGNLTMTHGTGASAVINQTGGDINLVTGQAWIGEDGGSATWNMSGGTASVGVVHIAQNASANGTLNMNGGTLTTTELTTGNSGAVSTLSLNGGVIQASANNNNFLHDIFVVNLQAGGAIFDSQAFNITIPEALPSNGDPSGGLTKNGVGTLKLTGANSYTGPTVVNAGSLIISTDPSGGGDYTVADGADLNLIISYANAQLNMANLTLGATTGATLDIDLGAFGNPTVAPINASSVLTFNGVTTVNLADGLPQIGQFPLIKYGSTAGSGSFVVGSIPVGVGAYISNNVLAASIDVVITNVNLPRWEGLAGGDWDVGVTTNWLNIGNSQPTVFGQGNVVTFNDSALGTTTVNLAATVNPGGVTVNNNTLLYALVGPGKISGNVGITKQGASSLTIANTGGNDFTGPLVISGGTVNVTNLANGGSPSAIGASSAGATNLVLAGGKLSYAGPAVAIDRGYMVTADGSSLETVSNLTLSGVVRGSTGTFSKSGLGQLTYTGVSSSNVLSTYNTAGSTYLIRAGTVVLDGSAGTQTNYSRNTNLGFDTGVDPTLILTNTTLITRSMQLGNAANCTGTLIMNSNSTMKVEANNFAVGYSTGTASAGVLTQNPGSLVDTTAELWVGQGALAVGTYNLNGGILKLHNWLALGRTTSTGTFNMTGGTFTKEGGSTDFLVATGNGSTGTFNQSGGTVNTGSRVLIPENGNSATLGTYNLSGTGVLNVTNVITIGRAGGRGVFNMTGGTVNMLSSGAHLRIGTGGGSIGILNQSGGTFNLSPGVEYWVAENGGCIGTNNISGTAVVNCPTYVTIGRAGLGVVNMTGGTFNDTAPINNNNPFFIGIFGGGVGIWNHSGGALNINPVLHIGDGSTGTLNVSGGAVNVLTDVWIGQGATGTGAVTMASSGVFTNSGWLAIGREDGKGTLNLNGGTMVKTGGGNISIAHGIGDQSVVPSGTVNQNGGTFICATGETWIGEDSGPGIWNMSGGTALMGVVHLAQNSSATGTLNLNGGVFTASEVSSPSVGTSTLNFNGGTLTATGNNANFLHGLTVANINTAGAVIDSGANTIAVAQPLLEGTGGGGLTKLGTGALYLNGANTYTGPTVVSNGIFGGNGSLAGSLSVLQGATLAPGASIGTLTVNGSVSLTTTSTNVMEVNKTTGTNDVLSVGGTLTLGGTLVLKNLGGALAPNDTFHLFVPGSFAASTFSAVQSITPGQVVTWDISNVAINGTVKVAGVVNVPVALTPVVSGGNLTLSWPADQTGWTLQMQTNSLAVGLGTNWVDVAGSTTTNQVTLPIIPAPLSGFFRLVF